MAQSLICRGGRFRIYIDMVPRILVATTTQGLLLLNNQQLFQKISGAGDGASGSDYLYLPSGESGYAALVAGFNFPQDKHVQVTRHNYMILTYWLVCSVWPGIASWSLSWYNDIISHREQYQNNEWFSALAQIIVYPVL
jgi:hypothetical protein